MLGLGLSLVSIAVRQLLGFSPATLFGTSDQGVWYDPSDFTTLFQDSAGTTPVTALEQPVGLMLDKSRGLTANTKGGNVSSAGWFTSPDSVASSVTGDIDIKVKAALNAWASAGAQTLIGKRASSASNFGYALRIANSGTVEFIFGNSATTVVSAVSTATPSFQAGQGGFVRVTRVSSTGQVVFYSSSDGLTWSQLGIAISTTGGSIYDSSASIGVGARADGGEPATGKIYNVSISDSIGGAPVVNFSPELHVSGSTFIANTGEIWTISGSASVTPDGNHATQPTATSRPVVSARVNLLTKTEQFDDAYWTKAQLITAGMSNVVVAPDGATTADALTPDTSNAFHTVNRASLTLPNSSATFSVCAKANGYNFLTVQLANAGTFTKFFEGVFNLTTGTVENTGRATTYAGTRSISSLGNGWYRCTITVDSTDANSTAFAQVVVQQTNDPAASFAGDGTSGIFIWGADLRVANDGVGTPSYQRVNTATDYDSTGFPVYLRADGVDDGMVTNSIDFTATDKMTVVAGVRKLSDAAAGMLVELGASVNTNAGTFYVAGPSGATPDYGFGLRGTTNVGGRLATTYTSPNTAVLSVALDLYLSVFATQNIPRINASTPGTLTNVGNQNQSGNFGNYPLYLFRRGGTTLPFNGRFYGMTIISKLLSTTELAQLETYTNGKTRAFA